MNTWMEFFDVCGKFGLAVILAGAIGLERQLKGRAAGLRTHILVCLGSTLAMIVSNDLAREWNQTGANIWLDRGRIAAGIITGIGFLGAGAIINVGNVHKGLTTAATIWLVATLGISIGLGYQLMAVLATAFGLFTVVCLEYLEEHILPPYEHYALTMRMPRGLEKFHDIERTIQKAGFNVAASRIKINSDEKHTDITFDLSASAGPEIDNLAETLQTAFPCAERITFER